MKAIPVKGSKNRNAHFLSLTVQIANIMPHSSKQSLYLLYLSGIARLGILPICKWKVPELTGAFYEAYTILG